MDIEYTIIVRIVINGSTAYLLYRFETCHFCGLVRQFSDFAGDVTVGHSIAFLMLLASRCISAQSAGARRYCLAPR